MNEKNIVISNYNSMLCSLTQNLNMCCSGLSQNESENAGIIKTANILITAINSQLTILQSELDAY